VSLVILIFTAVVGFSDSFSSSGVVMKTLYIEARPRKVIVSHSKRIILSILFVLSVGSVFALLVSIDSKVCALYCLVGALD
jgi:hypothetical protein